MINEQLGELRYKIQELGFRRRGYYMYNRMHLIQEHKIGRRGGAEGQWGYCVDTAGKNVKRFRSISRSSRRKIKQESG